VEQNSPLLALKNLVHEEMMPVWVGPGAAVEVVLGLTVMEDEDEVKPGPRIQYAYPSQNWLVQFSPVGPRTGFQE
jgi:hypothetical protein